MIDENPKAKTETMVQGRDLSAWLREGVSVTLPRWALLSMGLGALVLLLAALD